MSQRSCRQSFNFRKCRRCFLSQVETVVDGGETSAGTTRTTERKMKKIVVIGGNGYVGQQVVKAALRAGSDVVSISRSGAPVDFTADASSGVTGGSISWEKGDITDTQSGWQELLKGADGVVSCLGAFGSNEFMEKVNGDANIAAIGAALSTGVPKFVFVSTAENNLPDFVLKGYFHGKRRAEQALLDAFPAVGAGLVLRPGFIYGTRVVPLPAGVPMPTNKLHLPLGLLGKPMEMLFSLPPVKAVRNTVPGMQMLLAPPVSVQNVGRVAAAAALGDDAVANVVTKKVNTTSSTTGQQASHSSNSSGDHIDAAVVNILTIADINEIASSL